jgi:dolichol kinase
VDDGVLTALLMGPYAAVSMLYGSLTTPDQPLRPPSWLVEAPTTLPQPTPKMPAREALLCARRNLVQLTTLCSFVLLAHLCTSKQVHIKAGSWPPKKRGRRSWFFVGYSLLISAAAVTSHIVFDRLSLSIWKGMPPCGGDEPVLTLLDLTYFDVLIISSFYQFCLYVMARLSHGGFTLGELGLVAHGATALFMETTNLTIALVRT